jgi:hypothetical protein
VFFTVLGLAWSLALVALAPQSFAVSPTRADAPERLRSADPDGGVPRADAGVARDADVERLRREAERVRALLGGTLDVSIEPEDLFDVALDDETAIRVEAARLAAILRPRTQPPERRRGKSSPASAAPDGGELRDYSALLAARLDLDRAGSRSTTCPKSAARCSWRTTLRISEQPRPRHRRSRTPSGALNRRRTTGNWLSKRRPMRERRPNA